MLQLSSPCSVSAQNDVMVSCFVCVRQANRLVMTSGSRGKTAPHTARFAPVRCGGFLITLYQIFISDFLSDTFGFFTVLRFHPDQMAKVRFYAFRMGLPLCSISYMLACVTRRSTAGSNEPACTVLKRMWSRTQTHALHQLRLL